MCCGNSSGQRRTSTQTRRRLNTQTGAPGPVGPERFRVTLPDGEVSEGLTEHEALMMTLKRGGGMEPMPATPN